MASLLMRNVAKSYGPVDVLRNINLDIKTGELIVFVGPPAAASPRSCG